MLMNLGGLTTLARYRPRNLVHVVFDNESLLSVGGFPDRDVHRQRHRGIAAAAGVPRTATVRTIRRLHAGVRRGARRGRADDDRREGRGRRAGGYVTDLALLENRFQFQQGAATTMSRSLLAAARRRASITAALQGRRSHAAARPRDAGDRPAADLRPVARRDDRRDLASTTTRGRRGTGTRCAGRAHRHALRRAGPLDHRQGSARTTPATRFPRGASSVRPA